MKNPVKIVDFRRKNAKSGGDLTGSGEILLDLLDKSLKYENLLLESENLKSEFGN